MYLSMLLNLQVDNNQLIRRILVPSNANYYFRENDFNAKLESLPDQGVHMTVIESLVIELIKSLAKR